MKKCVYIQSAGFSQDYNWKYLQEDCSLIEKRPSPYAEQLSKALFYEGGEYQAGRMKCADGGYCAVVRNLYIEGATDLVARPIYLNLCVEGLTEQEALAIEAAYQKDVPLNERRYWPAITRHYIQGEDFNMDGKALRSSLDQIMQTEPDSGTVFSTERTWQIPLEAQAVSERRRKLEKSIVLSIISIVSFVLGNLISNVLQKIFKFGQR